MNILHDTSLLPYNTFGIDVKANAVVTYESEEELQEMVAKQSLVQPLLHIGEGSNLLFLHDFPGTILRCGITDVSVLEAGEDKVLVRAGAGWNMDAFIAYALEHGWYGLENLSNIPGQVGASAVQNIGAYGVEVGDRIHAVNCISLTGGERRTFMREECQYAYRHSIFKTEGFRGRYAVVSVDYVLDLSFTPDTTYSGIRQAIAERGREADLISAQELRSLIISIRGQKLPDPRVLGNAGSFFMNPVVERRVYDSLSESYPGMPKYDVGCDRVKIPAAWLIEQCGWKGKTMGKAGVHQRQPLVLVNTGGASGADIKALSDRIMDDVMQKFGVRISPEVNFI